jgi:seryl-tRNA synthetase
MSYENIRKVGNEHSEWIKGLDFYKDDLQVLVHRLEEVAKTNGDFDARSGMEHFQNQFIIQRNNIEELKHKIREHLHEVSRNPALETDQVDSSLLADHENLSDEYKTLEKVINEIRKEFNDYLVRFRQ